jgi:murein DD-endopeptidase MepM/ murein hydrolase activator NlpD
MRKPLNNMHLRQLQYGKYDPGSNSFGMVRRNHQRAHQGWDLASPPGTPVYAITGGELTTGHSPSYGNWVSLKFRHHGHVRYAFYGHLQTAMGGNCSVPEGTLIGFTGRTGNASKIPHGESHLHFEIRTVEHPAHGLHGRIDPGEILGYETYSCGP